MRQKVIQTMPSVKVSAQATRGSKSRGILYYCITSRYVMWFWVFIAFGMMISFGKAKEKIKTTLKMGSETFFTINSFIY